MMKKYSFLIFTLSFNLGCLTNTERGPRPFVDMEGDRGQSDTEIDFGKTPDVMTSDEGKDISERVLPDPVEASIIVSSIKTFRVSWADVENASEYRILEAEKKDSPFVELETISTGIGQFEYSMSLYQNASSKYKVQSCNSVGCVDSEALSVSDLINDAIGYLKADNPGTNDLFASVSLNENGNVMVVGAPNEESAGVGVNNGQGDDNSLSKAGAAYIFEKRDGQWIQSAFLKASNTGAGDEFGIVTSISADGKTIAIGAPGEASKGIGVNSNEEGDDSAQGSGAVYVFTNAGANWRQIAYLKASNSEASDKFGEQVALSADGKTLAVSATDDASNSKIINQGLNDNSAIDSGAVYVFSRSGNTWIQESYLKTNETVARATMGFSLALSGDGNVLATNHNTSIFIFNRNGSSWRQSTKIDPEVVDEDDSFGGQLALSKDGKTLVVSAFGEDGNSKGINGDVTNNASPDSGAAYVFTYEQGLWSQQAYLKASNAKSGDLFGTDLSIDFSGNFIAISSIIEGSGAKGVNGNQSDNNSPVSGAVYVFERSGTAWKQVSYLKSTNTSADYAFGFHIALSGDGRSLAAGSLDASGAMGIGGDANDNSAPNSGSIFLY